MFWDLVKPPMILIAILVCFLLIKLGIGLFILGILHLFKNSNQMTELVDNDSTYKGIVNLSTTISVVVVVFTFINIYTTKSSDFKKEKISKEGLTQTQLERSPSGHIVECVGNHKYLVITGYRYQRVPYLDKDNVHIMCD